MTKLADHAEFTAQGKSWTVRMTPGAWIALEDEGLGDVQELAKSLQASPSFKTFVRVLRAGLRGGGHGDVTLEKALELADEIGSEGTVTLIMQVIQASFPPAKGRNGEGNDKPPEA